MKEIPAGIVFSDGNGYKGLKKMGTDYFYYLNDSIPFSQYSYHSG